MTDAKTLLPCPFCGGEPHVVAYGHAPSCIECKECGVVTAPEMWNRRASSSGREGWVGVPPVPTMGQWDDFCAVFHVPFDSFIAAYQAMLSAAPAKAAGDYEAKLDVLAGRKSIDDQPMAYERKQNAAGQALENARGERDKANDLTPAAPIAKPADDAVPPAVTDWKALALAQNTILEAQQVEREIREKLKAAGEALNAAGQVKDNAGDGSDATSQAGCTPVPAAPSRAGMPEERAVTAWGLNERYLEARKEGLRWRAAYNAKRDDLLACQERIADLRGSRNKAVGLLSVAIGMPHDTTRAVEYYARVASEQLTACQERLRAAEDGPKLVREVQVGNTIFGVGIKWSTVIARAERELAYQNTPEREAERKVKRERFLSEIDAAMREGKG